MYKISIEVIKTFSDYLTRYLNYFLKKVEYTYFTILVF